MTKLSHGNHRIYEKGYVEQYIACCFIQKRNVLHILFELAFLSKYATICAYSLTTRFVRLHLVSRELPVHLMRPRGNLAQALDAILLVRVKVTLEPVPCARILLRTLPGEDMRCDPVEEPAVV